MNVEAETAAFLRRIKREKIVTPGPGQHVDHCHYSKTGWAVWVDAVDGQCAYCTCKPAKAPRGVGQSPAGYMLVPIEPTQAMIRACKGALYRHIAALSDAEKAVYKNTKGGYRVEQKLKVIVRWRAMLEAAAEAGSGFKAAHPSGESGPVVTPACPDPAPPVTNLAVFPNA